MAEEITSDKSKYEYDSPVAPEEIKQLASALATNGLGISLEEKTKYTVALELFKTGLLPMITELDKEHVEILVRHDTLIASARALFNLEDDPEIFRVIDHMDKQYQLHQISFKRKSRQEIVNILRNEVTEVARSVGDKLGAKK